MKPPRLLPAVLLVLSLTAACGLPPGRVTLALLGDIILGRGVTPSAEALAYLAPELHRADLALANLESPLSGNGLRGAAPIPYNLCAPAERAAFLSDWGLDLLSLANNHALDCGPDGIGQTRAALAAAGLTGLPPGTPVFETVRGLRLAFLAFDDVSVPLDPAAASAVVHAAAAGGTHVVVLIHWGAEYQGGADARQRTLAQVFAAAGADLVVGSHPHVLQPAEWIENGGRKTLVLYSLGNALFDQPGLPDTRQSALVVVTLGTSGAASARSVPFAIDVPDSRVTAPDAQTAARVRSELDLP